MRNGCHVCVRCALNAWLQQAYGAYFPEGSKRDSNGPFKHTQKLPLKYFDNNTHGEIMSHFTNDVDTVQEAMNNSFAMVIQSFLTLFGTITMMLVLSVRLTIIVVVFLFLCSSLSNTMVNAARNIITDSRRSLAISMVLFKK